MKYLFIFGLFLCTFLISCTDKEKARNFGGTETINLPKGQKLMMITWKESDIWYLTKPMSAKDTAETYTFQEESSYGVWEGTVIIKESK